MSYLFAFLYCSWGSQGKNTEVVCHTVDHVWSELSTMTHPSWVALHSMAEFPWVNTRLWSMWSDWLVFCDCGFHSVCPLMEKDKRLMETSWWERLTEGETGSCSNGRGHAQFNSVQSLSRVWLFAIPWIAACQPSLSITNSRSLLKLVSIKSVIPFNHLILCCPLLLPPSIFPSIKVFSNESVLHIRWPKYWSFSFSISLLMNIQDWFPVGWTGWISLQSKGLSRVFSSTTIQKHQFFGSLLSS